MIPLHITWNEERNTSDCDENGRGKKGLAYVESQLPLGRKVCISALQFRKIWKVYVSASFKVESFEVCISTKEAMESEDMFATAENKMEGF